tara:strand:- start:373 stop:1710 length:1338 start_codon:yes stop_codon:yes gene_type:complete
MPEITESKMPKTVNEALKILAYNEFFWDNIGAYKSRPKVYTHPKDRQTVHSLADAQYPWTEKQAKLAVILLKRYACGFERHSIDIRSLLDTPVFDHPFRKIDWDKSIEKYEDDNGEWIELKFPYNKKIISLIRVLKDKKGLPSGTCRYDGESKKWTIKATDVTCYYCTLIAVRYDFKFSDQTLIDLFYEIRKEKNSFKKPVAVFADNSIAIQNAPESLQEYWNGVEKDLIRSVDKLKSVGLAVPKIPAKGWNEGMCPLTYKVATSHSTYMWIDSNVYSRDSIVRMLDDLDSWPIIMPVSGELDSRDTVEEIWNWIKTFEANGVDIYKQISWGFDADRREGNLGEWVNDMRADRDLKDKIHEIIQMSKQFKYIDQNTKVYFMRNKITRTQIRSKFEPKTAIMDIGGGYWSSGGGNLKIFLDNLPKKLYYTSNRPMRFDNTKAIIKV